MKIAMTNTLTGIVFPSLDICLRYMKQHKRPRSLGMGFSNDGHSDC
jgi:hypothetical protein